MKSKILIVEDETTSATNFEQWFKSFGFDVAGIAGDAKDAIREIKLLKPDLILMDISLKGKMVGKKIADIIREFNIPVIYLTAQSIENNVNNAKPGSLYSYLTKPVNKFELKSTIELLLLKKQINETLSDSEKNYRELVDHSMVGVYKTKLNGEIIFANHALARMFQFDDVEDIISKNVNEFYCNSEDREKILKILKKNGFLRQHELSMKTRTGKKITIIFSASLVGETLSGMMMDITERIEAERTLKENEKKFKALIDKSTDLIRIFDDEGKITFDSPSSQRILGYHEGFFIGKDPIDFIHPDDQSRVKKALREVYENKNMGIPTEFRIRKVDDTYIPVESVAQNLTDLPGVKGIVATTHPLTEQKKVEKALRKSERLLLDIIDFLPDATFAIDSDGKIIAWNQAVEKMTGTSKEEMVGKGNYEYAIPWYGERRPILIDLIGKENLEFRLEYDFIEEEGQTLKAEIYVPSVYGGKGAYLWVTASPLLDSNGQQYGAIESVRDITERKKAETQIFNSLKEKDILLQEIHHRVKNNLQIIISLLDLQKTYVKEDEMAENVLRESQNRVLSMAMIHEMLYQSKDLSRINFTEYLKILVSNLFHTYGVEKSINLNFDADKFYLNVETSVPLGLIISEIISNSLKYAFPGDRTGEVYVSIKNNKNDFELVISDDGIGFPENIDFKNVNSSLGLQLVNSLVHQLDGSIEMDKKQGTKFIIKFKELTYIERV